MAIRVLVVVAIVGGGLLFLLDHYRQSLLAWALADSFRAKASLLFLIAIGSMPLPVIAAYMWQFGGKVIRANRYPPEGITLIRDTPVIYGAIARRRGRVYQGLSVIFLFSFGCILWILWRIWHLT
jgi:hypothetical protein